jgi:hypothetical protein
MPWAPKRPCATPGCSALVDRGYCPAHQHRRERQRRVTRELTYSETWWRAFRLQFVSLLVEAGVPPVCGAVLPGGPQTRLSRCQSSGLLTGTEIHLHHEPPLTDEEQRDRSKVCAIERIVLLCSACHNALPEHRT